MEPAASKMKCPACRGPVRASGDARPVCHACGWGSRDLAEDDAPDDANELLEMVDDPRPELADDYSARTPKRRKKRRPAEPERRREFPGYLVGVAGILAAWAGLADSSRTSVESAFTLVIAGICVNLIGLGSVFFCATRDGVDRLRFLDNVVGGNMTGMMVVGLVELAVTPFFCLVYLALSPGTAWKPVSVYALGVAMVASGVWFAGRLDAF